MSNEPNENNLKIARKVINWTYGYEDDYELPAYQNLGDNLRSLDGIINHYDYKCEPGEKNVFKAGGKGSGKGLFLEFARQIHDLFAEVLSLHKAFNDMAEDFGKYKDPQNFVETKVEENETVDDFNSAGIISRLNAFEERLDELEDDKTAGICKVNSDEKSFLMVLGLSVVTFIFSVVSLGIILKRAR